jgi:hypothetical protein
MKSFRQIYTSSQDLAYQPPIVTPNVTPTDF